MLAYNKSQSLCGLGVLVVRPKHQATTLCQWINAHDGFAICLPTIQIMQSKKIETHFYHLKNYKLMIFTSTNAVEYALPIIQKLGGIPYSVDILALGKATANKLSNFGIKYCIKPDTNPSSEQLLLLPRLQNVYGQHVLIIRGNGGRTLIANTLVERGAHVDHAIIYYRIRPIIDTMDIIQLWAIGQIGAVVVLSTESLSNLFDMLNNIGKEYLRNTPLIIISNRIRQAAVAYGCQYPIVVNIAEEYSIKNVLLTLGNINKDHILKLI